MIRAVKRHWRELMFRSNKRKGRDSLMEKLWMTIPPNNIVTIRNVIRKKVKYQEEFIVWLNKKFSELQLYNIY